MSIEILAAAAGLVENKYEFENSTLSGILAIVSAVFAFGYPLILQCVERINNIYNSTNFLRLFRDEPVYKSYHLLLVFTIITAVICPFMLVYIRAIWFSTLILFMQSVLLVLFIFVAIALFKLIMVYYSKEELLNRIVDGDGSEEADFHPDIDAVTDMAIYVAKDNDRNLYHKTIGVLTGAIYEVQSSQENGQEVTYSISVKRALEKIAVESLNKDSLFYRANNITPALMNAYSSTAIPDFVYKFVWRVLSDTADADNPNWIRQHWQLASTYYIVRSSGDNAMSNEEKQQFVDFHIMLGAMLVYIEKYSMLRYIINYTTVQPPDYYFVPSHFNEIIDFIKRINHYKDIPLGLLSRYQFKGLDGDIGDDHVVYINVLRYMALLVIRLWSMSQYYINDNPMSMPLMSNKVHENEEIIRTLSTLKQMVKVWYADGHIEAVGMPVLPSQLDVESFIDDAISNFKIKNETINKNAILDKKKLKKIREDIIVNDNRKDFNLPSRADSTLTDEHAIITSVPVSTGCHIEKESICEGWDVDISNLGEVLIEALNRNELQYYDQLFVRRKSRVTYRVNYKNIFKALGKLDWEGGVILNFGVPLYNFTTLHGTVDGLEEHDGNYIYKGKSLRWIPSRQCSFILIRRDQLPFIERADFPIPPEGVSELNATKKLYCSIDNFRDGQDYYSLSAYRFIKIYEPDVYNNYIRLNIDMYGNKQDEMSRI